MGRRNNNYLVAFVVNKSPVRLLPFCNPSTVSFGKEAIPTPEQFLHCVRLSGKPGLYRLYIDIAVKEFLHVGNQEHFNTVFNLMASTQPSSDERFQIIISVQQGKMVVPEIDGAGNILSVPKTGHWYCFVGKAQCESFSFGFSEINGNLKFVLDEDRCVYHKPKAITEKNRITPICAEYALILIQKQLFP